MHIGNFHPLLVHYPIVLLTVVLALDLVRVFSSKEYDKLALWALVFSLITLVPAIVTGIYAGEFYAQTNPTLIIHRYLGFVTGGYTLLHLLWRIYVLRTKRIDRIKWLLLLSLINFILMAVTADQGGLLGLGKTPFTTSL